jgi:hypothetical protein
MIRHLENCTTLSLQPRTGVSRPRSPTRRLQSDNPSTSRTQPGLHDAGTCENRPMSGSMTLRGASRCGSTSGAKTAP